jgi:hypothetical protein
VRQRLALAAVALAAVVLVVVVTSAPTPRQRGARVLEGPVFGVAQDGGVRWLVRVDPQSLRPRRGRRVRLAASLEGWALSPDRSRLVVAPGRRSELLFIDVARMRALGRAELGARGAVAALAWLRPDRVTVVLASPGCCAAGVTTVVTIDADERRVIARRRLRGGLTRVARTPDSLVLLLAPPAVIGPATLAAVDAAGRVGLLSLDGVSAGVLPAQAVGGRPLAHVRRPALAVDPRRRRAYVLPAAPQVVEVDLERRRVRHRWLSVRRPLLERIRDLLDASAAAAPLVGPVRSAAWLGHGRIAVAGYDAHVWWRPTGAVEQATRPAGLRLIDTRDWSVRTLDENATTVHAAAGLLLTTGPDNRGIIAYRPDGRRAFHLFEDRPVEIAATTGALALVRVSPAQAFQMVDVTRGRVIATLAALRLLPERAHGPWD